MSLDPSGPGARPNSSCLPSRESEGLVSAAPVFTALPRLTGDDHESPICARVALQRSWPPTVPDRFDVNTTSSPSSLTFG